MNNDLHTDLAYERNEGREDIPGSRYTEEEAPFGRLHTLQIESEEAAAAIGCARGTYKTMFFPKIWELSTDEEQAIAEAASSLLSDMARFLLNREDTVGARILTVGLGNRAITADAVGPRAADSITATAHLRENAPDLLKKLECAELAVVTPGVMAQSGLESAELVKRTAEVFRPELVLVIDALAARSFDRLGCTVQFSDSGLAPGAGIGNRRAPLDRKTLGCPVIGIGVPTVTDTATLIYDTFARAGRPLRTEEERGAAEAGRSYFVSPREADTLTERFSSVIAYAVNAAFGIPRL